MRRQLLLLSSWCYGGCHQLPATVWPLAFLCHDMLIILSAPSLRHACLF